MKKYQLIVSPVVQDDLKNIYQFGLRNWGVIFIAKPFIFEDILCYLARTLQLSYQYKENTTDNTANNNQNTPESDISDCILNELYEYAVDGASSDLKESIKKLEIGRASCRERV